MLRRVLSPLRLVHRQLALKHLSKSFLNGNGTCNSIAINVYTYLLAYFSFFFRCFKSACKEPECASSDFLCSKLFLFFSFSPLRKKASNVKWIKIKGKIAFNAAEKKTSTTKRIKSRRANERWFRKVWPPARIRPIGAQKDQVISLPSSYAKSLFCLAFLYATYFDIGECARRRQFNVLWCRRFGFFSPFVIKQKKSDLEIRNQFSGP